MKKLFLSLIALAAVAVSAQAQQYQVVNLATSATLTNSATGTYSAVVNCRAANQVGILTTSVLSGAGTDDIVFSFSKSADGVNFETTPSVTVTNASNGATAVKKYTVVDVTGVHTLKLVSVLNNSTNRTLTHSVVAGVKNIPVR